MEKEKIIIGSLIREIRGCQVIIDKDLARLYGVETKALNQAVKRNIKRFPEDFMFQLTLDECLRSQIVTLNEKQGRHLKYLPYAFTEQGIAMLSSVLRSEVAINVNIKIMRSFVYLRKNILSTQIVSAELAASKSRLELLEKNNEDNLGAINDLSEDVSREIDNIYMAIAALSARSSQQPSPDKPIKKIRFK